jgi:hypothetical protein
MYQVIIVICVGRQHMATKQKKTRETKLLVDLTEDLGFPLAILFDSHNIMIANNQNKEGKWLPSKFYGHGSWRALLRTLHAIILKAKLGRKKKNLRTLVENLIHKIDASTKEINVATVKIIKACKHVTN